MSKLFRSIIAAALIAGASSLAASDPAQAQDPAADPATATTATVITNEGLSALHIILIPKTAVTGKEVTATDKTDTLEFEPGEHEYFRLWRR
jgi:hypothetical protein